MMGWTGRCVAGHKPSSMVHRSLLRLAAATLLTAGVALAGEYAVLHTGFRIATVRHETRGDQVRLFTGEGAFMDLPAAAVARFEPDGKIDPVGVPGTAVPAPDETLDAVVDRFSAELGLPPALVHSVIAAESAYDPQAVSSKGAVGLMQLMPETARELNVTDRRDPSENVRGGTTYLKQLLDRYAGSRDSLLRALAAYNAGPARVDAYNGLPPYNETRAFVRRVIERFLALTEPATDD